MPVIRPSRGTHIILPAERLPVTVGAIVPGRRRAHDLRPAVARPDADRDDRQRLRGRHRPRAARRERRRVPARARPARSSAPSSARADIAGAYAGVRPLISTGDPKKSVDISRKAELYETSSGMVTITGGKLTTWRRMAKMTVDRLVERDGRDAPCRTGEIPLGMPVAALDLPRVEGVGEDAYEQLAGRYGYAAHEVLAIAAERGELAQPILPGMPDLLAEATFAGRREQARSVADVLLRRTRLGADRGARPAGARRAGAGARRAGARGRAGVGRCPLRGARPSASAPTPPRRDWWSAAELPSGPRRNFPRFPPVAPSGPPPSLEPAASHEPPPRPARPARPAGARRAPGRRAGRAGSRPPPTRRSTAPRPTSTSSAASTSRVTAPAASSTSSGSTATSHVFLSRFNGGAFRAPERVDNGIPRRRERRGDRRRRRRPARDRVDGRQQRLRQRS